MTTQSGLVPIIDETTGRLPDEFAPPSVAAISSLGERLPDLEDMADAAAGSATDADRSRSEAASSATAAAGSHLQLQPAATACPHLYAGQTNPGTYRPGRRNLVWNFAELLHTAHQSVQAE